MTRAERGAQSYQAGLAAEDIAARDYQAKGGAILARRWRCPAGEIDLIIRMPDCIVFCRGQASHRRHRRRPRNAKTMETLGGGGRNLYSAR